MNENSEPVTTAQNNSEPLAARINSEVDRHYSAMCARIDRQFAWLMLVQWAAAVGVALWISPLAWAGDTSYLHPHVTLALLYGGILTIAPVAMIRLSPGARSTRLSIAVAQMLMSALLIHLSGGRIETHFHVFGSLAFLAYYLDWQVLAVATGVIGIDHILRGTFLPFSAFGSYTVQPWRWTEHIVWVLFCDVFLVMACLERKRSMRALATRHVEQSGELIHAAHHDPLTGLANRACLSTKISMTIRDCETNGGGFGCLYIDLDRFKEVNDRLGHACGDALLRAVAARVQTKLGDKTLLVRIGGDEFVAIVPVAYLGQVSMQVEETARNILRALLQPFDIDGNVVSVGASIGISQYPRDAQNEDDILFKSDQTMYRVKRSGRNGYQMYSPALFPRGTEKAAGELALYRAICEGELGVNYQPIFHADGTLAGIEALARWQDPVRGNISPGHFIPLAEETGLIVPLGYFILGLVCRQLADWRSRNVYQGPVAVNVSSLQLAKEDFAMKVMQLLDEHGLPPQCLELEVTETSLVQDAELAERQLQELRRRGMRIAIDDFGTGYSSLSRLRQLTLDALKIDRLFVEGAENSETDRIFIQHIVGMAHSLGMTVIAEGVETEGQLAILRSLKCDQMQGFLLGAPVGIEKIECVLKDFPQEWPDVKQNKEKPTKASSIKSSAAAR